MTANTNAGAATIPPPPYSTTPTDNAPLLIERGTPLNLIDLPTECLDDTVRIGNRIDPYWADLWPVGSTASWVDLKAATAQIAAKVGRMPSYLTGDPAAAETKIADISKLPAHLNVLSVLDSWGAATGEQLAAFTGLSHLANGTSQTMTDLFTTELVDVGVFSNVLFNTRNTPRGRLYRQSKSGAFQQKVSPMLTYSEWVSTTGGIDSRVGGGQHDRHNVITTEVALRIAEVCDVGAVVGEKLSSADLLGYTGLGLPSKGLTYTRAADATIIRRDGARIALEVTATFGRALEAKMQHWADLIASRRMDDSGLAVMFLLIDKPNGKKGASSNKLRSGIYRALREAVRNTPGVSYDRVASRIGIADYREWFPEMGKVSPCFFALECDTATGPPDALWERSKFLDNTDLPFHPTGDWATAALDNMSMLRSIPHWLRAGRTPPELWRVLLKDAGLKSIPVPPVQRSDINPGGRKFGEAFGFVAATKPPVRIRTER
jgi:hypothetical protein